MLVRSDKGAYKVIDFREEAGANAHVAMFVNNTMGSRIGGLSVAVPGELKGYATAHQLYGKLAWKDLILPSVQLARQGWKVNQHLQDRIDVSSCE